ncbi:MAG: radical SAM protein [Lachnospiraceae bacterium]|nr:radical SAM protein [Lachnospiraceae bacterium]
MVKVAFLTLGCKVNSYETDKMKKSFEDAGYIITAFDKTADVYIVNTCTVTNIADRKSRQMLHKARKLNPDALVVAAGCYVDSAIKKGETDKSIDIFITNKNKEHITEIVNNAIKKRVQDIKEEVLPQKEHTRAYIKVQDGCCQYCTYCIIPYVRGGLSSRSEADVVAEARELALKGYKEIVITGIHLSSYGTSINKADSFIQLEGKPLLSLLEALDNINGIERIRLGSLEPRIITRDFVKELSSIHKLCPHFHLSLQSGSSTVLKLFKYSRRYGTIADQMHGQIQETVKSDRSSRLSALEKELGEIYQQQVTGKYERVLFEEITEIDNKKYITGYNERYIRIAVPSYSGEDLKICNTIQEVCISGRIPGGILFGYIEQ